MLSLVAYDASDSEEDSQSQNESDDTENENNVSSNVGSVQVLTKSTEEPGKSGIFNTLPQPQTNQIENVEEEDDEFLRKKEMPTEKPKKQAIKITVPSLAQFDSDEDDENPAKRAKVTEKACGLFALLPPPKTAPITTKHFVPNSVKRKMNQNKKPTPKKLSTSANNKKEIKTDIQESDDDDDDLKTIPDTFDDEMWQKVCGKKERRTPKPFISDTPTESFPIIQPDPEVSKPYDGLDNQAFKELIGGNNKRKGEIIDLIEINEDEILYDKNIWMTKSLTDPEMAPKYVVKDPVNDTCKRKHHITYLAQQAKANEQELQNQWASSRFTRQKTQAKYGF